MFSNCFYYQTVYRNEHNHARRRSESSLDESEQIFALLPTIYSDVTVRQLLSHTSGVNRDVRTANVDNFTVDEFKKRFSAAPLSFKPGEKWEYSNNGYILLGLIIEAVSGESFGEFLARRIAKPLGMKKHQ